MRHLKLALLLTAFLTIQVSASHGDLNLSFTEGLTETTIMVKPNSHYSESKSGNEIDFHFLLHPGIPGTITLSSEDVNDVILSQGFLIDLDQMELLVKKSGHAEGLEFINDKSLLEAYEESKNGPVFCGTTVLKGLVETSNGLEATISFQLNNLNSPESSFVIAEEFCDKKIIKLGSVWDAFVDDLNPTHAPLDYCPDEECVMTDNDGNLIFGRCSRLVDGIYIHRTDLWDLVPIQNTHTLTCDCLPDELLGEIDPGRLTGL